MAVKGAKGRAGRVAVWVILALLVIGLAGFGATNFGGGVRTVGSVGDVEITVDEYARALQEELRRLSQQTGEPMTLSQAQLFGIDRAVLASLVGRAALDAEARRIGLSVGDEQVGREIVAIPAFQGVDGRFDREGYAFVLERSGLTPAEFEERVRADTARDLLQGAITGGVRLPGVYADTIFDYLRETREATWATLSEEDLAEAAPEPEVSELQAFYTENPETFTAPETRVISYAWITPDRLAPEIEAGEDELRALYEERADTYRQPERRLVERLVFTDEDAAQTAAESIAAGEATFDDLVAERNLTLDDVDLGDVSRTDLGEAAEAVFALDGSGIAGPAPSALGPALFRVNAILAAQEVPFEEARADLQAELQADRARRIIDDLSEQVEDLLAGGATLEELAEETEMEFGQLELDPDAEGGPLAYDAFRAEALAVVEGDYPEIRRLDDDGIFALRLDAVREPQVRPFEEVRDEVEAAWRTARLVERLTERAEALAERIAAGASFEELGLEAASASGIARDGTVEGLPPAAVAALFEMETGAARAVAAGESALVLRLDDVTPPDGTSEEARQLKAALATSSAEALSADLLDAFVRAAEREAGISLNQSAINAVHAQFP